MNLTTPTPAKKKRRVWLWLLALLGMAFGYAGWWAYDANEARWEAKMLGWQLVYTDPYEEIQANWKMAFKKETWTEGVTFLRVPRRSDPLQHTKLLERLNPQGVLIEHAHRLNDFSVLEGLRRLDYLVIGNANDLTNVDTIQSLPLLKFVKLDGCAQIANLNGIKQLSLLESIWISNCPLLTNLDGIEGLSKLNTVTLSDCTELKNVDALKNLPALKYVESVFCPKVTKESIDALRATHPKAKITFFHDIH